ncbi:hypothetical protein [uncultured Clostridium sp.]|jgi:hypothetical protein|uniref:hypothetical protein n=1 Tax=uncultured Clostridium sp. TaxID=59620 RepID=UPI00261E9B8E|nr:hypothetical protein [uncultured Clostridium sp.]
MDSGSIYKISPCFDRSLALSYNGGVKTQYFKGKNEQLWQFSYDKNKQAYLIKPLLMNLDYKMGYSSVLCYVKGQIGDFVTVTPNDNSDNNFWVLSNVEKNKVVFINLKNRTKVLKVSYNYENEQYIPSYDVGIIDGDDCLGDIYTHFEIEKLSFEDKFKTDEIEVGEYYLKTYKDNQYLKCRGNDNKVILGNRDDKAIWIVTYDADKGCYKFKSKNRENEYFSIHSTSQNLQLFSDNQEGNYSDWFLKEISPNCYEIKNQINGNRVISRDRSNIGNVEVKVLDINVFQENYDELFLRRFYLEKNQQ